MCKLLRLSDTEIVVTSYERANSPLPYLLINNNNYK